MFERISIIIPVASQEAQLDVLLDDLKSIKTRSKSSASEGTRTKSVKAGEAKARNVFLWFLHADSRVSEDNLNALAQSLQQEPDGLHYFDLAFDKLGLLALNAWGANMRSRLFGTPFGDQGFCIAKAQFEKAGGYPENVPYGEDLLFVWCMRQVGIRLNRIPSKLVTSARKYDIHGWLKLTLLYQWLVLLLTLCAAEILGFSTNASRCKSSVRVRSRVARAGGRCSGWY